MMDLRNIARLLGGEVQGGQVAAPGPGHGARDRSLSVHLSATAPDGFIAFSHAGDDFKVCRDYISERLGLRRDYTSEQLKPKREGNAPQPNLNDKRTGAALALWREGIDPRGTLAERYLTGRGLELGDDLAGEVLRWHPRLRAMVALFRGIRTDRPQALSRTYLDDEGRKLGRKFLGPVGGAAIKLDADENVLGGLHIGEGVETCLAARQLGLRPTWALGSCGAVAAFPSSRGSNA